MMERTWALDTTTGQMTETYQPWYDQTNGVSVPHTLLGEKFGVVEVEGVVTANEYATIGTNGASLVEGRTQLSAISTSTRHGFDDGTPKIFLVSTGEEVLGRTVTLYVKVDTNATTNSTKAVVIGEPILSEKNTVVSTTAGYGTDKTLTDFATSNGLTAETAPVYSYNYGAAGSVTAAYAGAGRGITTTLIDNDADGKYEYAFVVDPSFGEVTSKTTTGDGNLRISGLAKTDYVSKDIAGFDDVARGDYVNYIEVGGTLYVSKAETVTGQMTQYDKSKQSYFLVDGTQYGTSQITNKHMGTIEPLTGTVTASADGYLDKDAVFYLDSLGNIVAVGDVDAASQFAFVSAVDTTTIDGSTLETANRAKATLSATGDTVVKTVYGIDNDGDGSISTTEEGANATVNTLYTYTVNGDDQFVFTKLTYTETDNKAVKLTKGETTVTVDGTKYFADNETAYIYIAPKTTYAAGTNSIATLGTSSNPAIDTVSAYTGYQNAPSFDGTTDAIVIRGTGDEANIVKAIVIVTESAGLSDNLMYLYDYVGNNNNGQVFNVNMNGEIVKNVTITSTGAAEGMVAKYTETEKGYSIVALTTNVASGNITVKADNSFVVGNQEYKLTADSVIANIDGDDTTVTDVALVKGDYVTVVYEPDFTVKAVYVTVPYAANNAEIHSTNARWSAITNNAATYTGASSSSTNTCEKLLEDVVTSYGSTVTVYSNRTSGTSGDLVIDGYVYANTDKVTGSATLSSQAYYVVVTSQDGATYAVYTVTATIS